MTKRLSGLRHVAPTYYSFIRRGTFGGLNLADHHSETDPPQLDRLRLCVLPNQI